MIYSYIFLLFLWKEIFMKKTISGIIAEDKNANMITFELGTTLPDDAAERTSEHMSSFSYGYEHTAVRDRLFEQSK